RPAQPPWRPALAWAIIAVGAVVVGTFLGPGLRPGLASALDSPQLLLMLGVLAILAGVGATLALSLARPGLEPQRVLRVAPGILLALLLAIAASYGASGEQDMASGLDLIGVRCGAILCVAAVLPAVALFTMTRRLAALRPGVTGLFIGLAA